MLEDTSGRFGDVWELTSDGKTTTSRLVYAAGTPEAEAFMAQGPHDLDPPEPLPDSLDTSPDEPDTGPRDADASDPDAAPVEPTTEDQP